jgi:fatty-acyl-CoA synthase
LIDESYSLIERFEVEVERDPDAIALVHGSRSYSYRKLASESATLAVAFADLGITKGDRIGVDLPNWPEWVVSLLAAARLGAVVVPLNPTLGYHEFKYQLRHAEVKICVVPQSHGDVDYHEFFDDLMSELPDLVYLITVGAEEIWQDERVFRYSDLLSSFRAQSPGQDAEIDSSIDLLFLLYTPGTLGKPKGVELTHRNLVWTGIETASALGMSAGDTALCSVPLSTVFGAHLVVSTLLVGGKIVMLESFDSAVALDLIEKFQVTVLHGVPTMFQLFMREPSFSERNLSSLRTGLVAGSPVTPQVVQAIRKWCNVEIAYGLTETGPTVSMTTSTDPEEKRENTVGKPLAGVELKLSDVKEANDYLPAPVGELVVRGPNVMTGYYRMPRESKKFFTDDGFFRTGDLACLDAEGYARIVGRSKEMIIRGGYNIYPKELEDIVRTHPAVERVCAIGIPNEILGELVGVCVVPLEGAIVTAPELKDYVHDQVADYKVPDIVRFFDAFPVSEDGKVLRAELARLVAAEVGAG